MNPDLLTGEIISAVLLLFLLYLVRHNRILTPRRTAFYCAAILLTILMLACEGTTLWAEGGGASGRTVQLLANVLGFALSPLLTVLLAAVHDERLAETPYLLIPFAANAALSALSPHTGWIFSVDAAGVYTRGPLFLLYVLTYLYGFFLLFWMERRQARFYDTSQQLFLRLLLAVLAAGTGLQVLQPKLHTTWACVTVVLALYYLFQRERQYQCDALTGLLNRQAYDCWEQQQPYGCPVCLVMLDIDDFKGVNDRCGHLCGDECLRRAAQLIRASFSKAGLCYRIGGDEFCVVGEPDGVERLRRGCALLEQRVAMLRGTHPEQPTVSWGCGRGKSPQEARRQADRALYTQKKQKHGEKPPSGRA